MATVDDKVIAMSFESTKFSSGVGTALSDINKLNAALSNMGASNNLGEIEKSANKVTLGGLSGVIDKIKGKFHFPEADSGFSEIEKAGNKVQLTGISGVIDKIKGKFHFPEAAEGFGEIERASGRVQFSGLHDAIQGVSKGFSVIQGAAAVALGNAVTRAASAGRTLASNLFGPIKGGLEEYSTNLNSIQTILANTQQSGATLKDVNRYLLDLNRYSDRTIYNFGQMAKSIGLFTAAGVDLKTSTQAIKGISNLAALSGSSAEQASTAMYQLSQAIASGKVGLQDWNSVVNAGMGGSAFQRALATTATNMGKLKDGAVALKGPMKNVSIDGQSFRESIMAKPGEQSWLTSDVLTKTLEQFTGDMTDAQLKAQGFTDEQIKSIQATAKSAQEAATNVKTLGQVFDVAKETIGSGWSQTFQTIFGDFGEAKKLFTGMSNGLNGIINDNANARNAVLAEWKKLGGRDELLAGLKAGFEGLKTIIAPLRDAWHEIFPPKTGQDLLDLTKRFRDFMESVKIGPETADNLKRSFAGVFALLDIGKQILGGIFTALGQMFSAMGDGSGGLLSFTGGIGDLLVKLDDWLKKGDKLHDFFVGLGNVLGTPISLLGVLGDKMSKIFGFDKGASGTNEKLVGMGENLNPIAKATERLQAAWGGFFKILEKIRDIGAPIVADIKKALGNIVDPIADALEHGNFEKVFTVVQTGLLAGIFLAIKKGLSGGVKVDLGGGFMKNVNEVLGTLKGNLMAIQQDIKAHALLQIAAAVGILAASVTVMSLINPERLGSAMTAMTVGLGELMGVMMLMNKSGGGFKAALGMGSMAASMAVLGTALLVLSGAMLILSKLNWEEIAKGLTATAGLLVVVGAGAKLLSGNALTLTAASVGLMALGVALNIMAVALKIFATMSWEELGRGLVGAAGGIVAIGLAANLLPMSMLVTGPALILLATGLGILGGAVKIFGSMDLATLAKGIGAIAASLVVIGLSMDLMPPTLPLTAIGLGLVASAMVVLSSAIALLGNQDIGTLAKGIGAMGLALVTLAAGLTLMVISLPGAAAFAVLASAMAVFVPTLGTLGQMKWGTIGKGLLVISASLIAISLAGAVAAPGLLVLGAALLVFGAAVLLVGTGVRMLAVGLGTLAGSGTKGLAVFMGALTALIALFPTMIINFIKGLVEIVAQIAVLAPKVVEAMGQILTTLFAFVIAQAPKFAEACGALITAFLKVLVDAAPQIVQAGWDLLKAFLKGMADNIADVVKQVGDIVVAYLNAVSSQYPRIVRAGLDVLINFLRGIGNNLNRVLSAAVDIVVHLATGIGNNVQKIIDAGSHMITKFIEGIGNSIDNIIDRGAAMVNRIITGIGNNISQLVDKGAEMAGKVIKGLGNAAEDLAKAGGDALLDVLRGIRKWVVDDKNAQAIGEEGRKIAVGLMAGIASGALGFDLSAFGRNIINKIKGEIKKVLHHFHIGSPSKVTAEEIGKPLAQGIAMGMDQGGSEIVDAGDNMIKTLQTALSAVPTDVGIDVNPTITPVLDLTQVKKDAKSLGDISNVTPITAALSYGAAAAISAAQAARADTDVDPETGAKVFKFEQNLYSPESLSEVEIYRQTNNQLSQAKSALGL